MDLTLYITGQLIITVLALGLVSVLRYGLRHALERLHIRAENRRQLLSFVTTALVFWLAILALLAYRGFFFHFENFPPRVMLALLPPLIVIIALLFSRFFGVLLRAVPESWLIYVQGFRILMELFLWLGYRGGYIPLQMTFEWLNYDIVVGITAVMAGYVFFANGRYRRLEAIIWNVFGMVLLLNVLLIAVLSFPSPARIFLNEPSNAFVALPPFIWIPGFIVPFALAMHLFSLKQLFFFRKRSARFRLRRSKGVRTKN